MDEPDSAPGLQYEIITNDNDNNNMPKQNAKT